MYVLEMPQRNFKENMESFLWFVIPYVSDNHYGRIYKINKPIKSIASYLESKK